MNLKPIHSATNSKINGDFKLSAAEHFMNIHTDEPTVFVVKKNKSIYPKPSLGYEISQYKVQDIDNKSDWLIAEAKYKYLKYKKNYSKINFLL